MGVSHDTHLFAFIGKVEPQQVIAIVTGASQTFEGNSPMDARLLNATGSFVVVDQHKAGVVVQAESTLFTLPRHGCTMKALSSVNPERLE